MKGSYSTVWLEITVDLPQGSPQVHHSESCVIVCERVCVRMSGCVRECE
jgi:hypothetical protein